MRSRRTTLTDSRSQGSRAFKGSRSETTRIGFRGGFRAGTGRLRPLDGNAPPQSSLTSFSGAPGAPREDAAGTSATRNRPVLPSIAPWLGITPK